MKAPASAAVAMPAPGSAYRVLRSVVQHVVKQHPQKYTRALRSCADCAADHMCRQRSWTARQLQRDCSGRWRCPGDSLLLHLLHGLYPKSVPSTSASCFWLTDRMPYCSSRSSTGVLQSAAVKILHGGRCSHRPNVIPVGCCLQRYLPCGRLLGLLAAALTFMATAIGCWTRTVPPRS